MNYRVIHRSHNFFLLRSRKASTVSSCLQPHPQTGELARSSIGACPDSRANVIDDVCHIIRFLGRWRCRWLASPSEVRASTWTASFHQSGQPDSRTDREAGHVRTQFEGVLHARAFFLLFNNVIVFLSWLHDCLIDVSWYGLNKWTSF